MQRIRLEAVKKWDWLRARWLISRSFRVAARCLSQFFHSLFALLLSPLIAGIACSSNADEPRSARQTFVVHVPPKISFESAAVPPQPTPSAAAASESNSDPDRVEAAFRLSGTSAAGITAWIELQSSSGDESFLPEVSLRIVDDERNEWNVTNQPETGRVLEATSNGTGAATLIVSSAASSEETVIITTIISND